MPIPILRLPFLALKNVFECAENLDALRISLCSRKSERAMKACKRNPSIFDVSSRNMDYFDDLEKFQLLLSEAENEKVKLGEKRTTLDIMVADVLELNFNVGGAINFSMKIDSTSQMEEYKGYKKHLWVDGIWVPSICSDDQLYIFLNDKVHGLQFLLKFFGANFCLGKCGWDFRESVPDLKRFVDFLNSLPKESEDVVVVQPVTVGDDAKLSDSDYKYLLETVTHDLRAQMTTSEDFDPPEKFSTKNLTLYSAPWFTLEHLLECECESVQVSGSKFSNTQLKEFIGKWLSGQLSHMKSVSLDMKETLDHKVVLDFPGISVEIEKLQRFSAPRKMTTIPTKTIKKKNGERANIKYVRGRMRHEFKFYRVE